MSRRRYLSTEISVDRQVNQLGTKYGDAPVLLYTWMIPHAADDGTINGDPYELLGMVWPQRRDKSEEDVIRCLTQIEEFGLIAWDRDAALIYFPAGPFYRYQSYIKEANRRKADPEPLGRDQRKTAENSGKHISPPTSAEISGDQRKTPFLFLFPIPLRILLEPPLDLRRKAPEIQGRGQSCRLPPCRRRPWLSPSSGGIPLRSRRDCRWCSRPRTPDANTGTRGPHLSVPRTGGKRTSTGLPRPRFAVATMTASGVRRLTGPFVAKT